MVVVTPVRTSPNGILWLDAVGLVLGGYLKARCWLEFGFGGSASSAGRDHCLTFFEPQRVGIQGCWSYRLARLNGFCGTYIVSDALRQTGGFNCYTVPRCITTNSRQGRGSIKTHPWLPAKHTIAAITWYIGYKIAIIVIDKLGLQARLLDRYKLALFHRLLARSSGKVWRQVSLSSQWKAALFNLSALLCLL